MAAATIARPTSAATHLHLWLRALNRTIAAAVRLQNIRSQRLRGDRGPPNALSAHHADLLIAEVDSIVAEGDPVLPPIALDSSEAAAETQLLTESPVPLPLARLHGEAELTAFDLAALLIAAAPQVASAYGRLYGYLLDDLTRLAPSVELILRLTHDGSVAPAIRRRQLGPGGALRRLGLIDAADPLTCELGTVLRPAPGLVEWLLGATPVPPVPLADPQLLRPAAAAAPLDAQLLPAARCLREAPDAVIGLWGGDPGRHDDAVVALAAAAGCAIYRSLAVAGDGDWAAKLRREAIAAAGCDALLWVETRQLLGSAAQSEAAAQLLMRLPQRIVLTGRSPWRPIGLVGARPYADVCLARSADAAAQWTAAIGALAAGRAGPLGERYRFGWRERQAAIRIAAADVRNRSNGAAPDFVAALDRACRLVAAPRSGPSVIVHEPRRTLRDLVLPSELYDQIAEIGPLVAHAEQVDTAWGFGRLLDGEGSIKALFSGDPGTGKTLAAEVIAESAGLQLLKVDLSQVTSKWVGETEKNLEEVFDHAEQSHAVLFFDEADALFGKRGEVRHGVDRYANLEVSYLLQRLETFSGRLIILASNLREEIDPAFIRRFQLALHFPRPAKAERLRLWRLAFAEAPVEAGIRFEEFADLDLTGGSITVAARMAALLAAAERSPDIRRDHIAAAIERQYRKEARLMAGGRGLDGLSVARARC